LHQLAKAKCKYLLHQNVVVMGLQTLQLPILGHLLSQGCYIAR